MAPDRALGAGSPCSGCNARCCYDYVVPVTGGDAYRISRGTGLAFEQFLVALPEAEATAHGFRLSEPATTYTLLLNKQPSRRKSKACVFLMELGEGCGRCGIYAFRPLVCQTFPAVLHHGSVDLRPDRACPQGVWNVAAMHLPAWRSELLRMHMESALYAMVVERWNGIVDALPEGQSRRLALYFSFVMQTYSRIAAVEGSVPAGEMERILLRWGQGEPTAGAEGGDDWRRFLARVESEVATLSSRIEAAATTG
jgi:Fe-S-cluster containining protein